MLVLIPMTIAGIYFYVSISGVLSGNTFHNLEQMLLQSGESIETSFTTFDNSCLRILSSSSLRENILSIEPDMDAFSLFTIKSSLDSELKGSMLFDNAWNSKLMSTLYLFLDRSTYCFFTRSSDNVEQEREKNIGIYLNEKSKKQQGLVFLPPSLKDQKIYFVRDLTNINTSQLFVKLVVGMDENVLYQKYGKTLNYPGAEAFLYDNGGMIYSHTDKTRLGQKVDSLFLNKDALAREKEIVLKNEEYYVGYQKILDNRFNFVVLIPRKQVLADFSKSMFHYLLTTLLIVLISLVLSILVSLGLTRFIKNLLNNINKVKRGIYETRMPLYKDPDLNHISETFNGMAGEIQHLIRQVYEKQILLRDTELKFLQSQMNPHFLFNVLTSIGYKARLSKDDTVYNMVTSLSELLQAGIYNHTHAKIPIRKELEYVRFYLFLQKARFGERLEYHIRMMDNDIPDYYLPKLCIEPLVENAVVHGLEKKVGKGTVTVTIYKASGCVYFDVADDGIGFDSGALKLGQYERLSGKNADNKSIGLVNTLQRIKLIYGDPYGITIKSSPGKGALIHVCIPVDLGGDAIV